MKLVLPTSLLAAALTAAMMIAAPSDAQSRRELAERIDNLEAELVQMQDRFMAGDPVAETLLQRMDELDYQMRAMNGEIERLSFENRRMRDELDRLGADVDSLLSAPQPAWPGDAADPGEALGADGEPTGAMAGEAGELSPRNGDNDRGATGENLAIVDPDDPFAEERAAATGMLGAPRDEYRPPSPQEMFASAQSRLRDGDFISAREEFSDFVAEYGDDPRAGEAYYWLGETYFVEERYGEAADAFIASLRNQPNGEKAPESLVRLAGSLDGLGQSREACDALARFNRQYPNASNAARARAARVADDAGCN